MLKQVGLILFLCSLLSTKLWAQATFGAEFTFSNNVIIDAQVGANIVTNPKSEYFRDLFTEKILSRCDGCVVIEEKNQYGAKINKIVYPDGFYFIIATDPGVVEVQTKPLTVDEIKIQLERFKNDLFQIAKEVGIFPGSRGGGHIHMGLSSSVGSDLLLMRNLLVDFANHPELAMGVLENSERNAPALAQLSQECQEAFSKIISEVDAHKIRSVKQLAKRINKEVYGLDRQKYQALNLVRIADEFWRESERTFEFRAIRPQRDETEFLIMTRVLEGRLSYLKTIKYPIGLNIPQFSKGAVKGSEQMIENFAKYLNETEISLSEFVSVFSLSTRLQNAAELWIKKMNKNNACSRFF